MLSEREIDLNLFTGTCANEMKSHRAAHKPSLCCGISIIAVGEGIITRTYSNDYTTRTTSCCLMSFARF